MRSEDEDDDGSCRACDSCRLKKIKCDKKYPCGSCSSRSLRCLRTMPDARKRKRRNSGSFDNNVQARLDHMQAQLDTITSILTATHTTATSYISAARGPASYSPLFTGTPPRRKDNVPAIGSHGKRSSESQSPASWENFASVKLLNSLVTNIKGQLQHLGKSSLLSMSIEAQLLSTALHEDSDKSDERDFISSVTDREDEQDYGKNTMRKNDALTQHQRTDSEYYGVKDAKENVEETQDKHSDFVAPACPGMKALLDASLDYVASNFLPVDWVEELDIKDHTPVLPSKERGLEFFDYYIEFILPFQQQCSISFVQMLRDEVYQPDTPQRLQKIICSSYIMAMVLFWPEKELQGGDIFLREKMFKNIWLALKDPSIFITANFINVQTLLFAAAAAEMLYHPGLCWMLISQCSHLAQTLGLHRQSAVYFERGLSQIEIEERRSLFWQCYTIEKTLSLTLGRTSSMPMYDCDVERKRNTTDVDCQTESQKLQRFGTERSNATVSLVEVYDAVYVRLYSAHAQRHTASDKRRAVRELDAVLRNVWADIQPWIIESRTSGIGIYRAVIAQAEFMYYVCMTMIHRVSKGVTDDESGDNTDLIDTPEGWQHSTDIALTAARKAILVIHEVLSAPECKSHSDCVAAWSLIFQPFAPFFELFISVIKTGCREDLQLMRSVTGILSDIQRRSESVRKLAHVAELFTRLATMAVLHCVARRKRLDDSMQASSVVPLASAAQSAVAVAMPLSMPTTSSDPRSSTVATERLTTPIESPSIPMANTLLMPQIAVSSAAMQFQPCPGSSCDGSCHHHCSNSSKSAPPYMSDHEIETFLLGGTVTQDASSFEWLLWDADGNPLYPPNFDWTTFDMDDFGLVDNISTLSEQQPTLSDNANIMPRF
ncbi:uncharacterized protein V1513DRAFT_436033 [Lipomyces chichibuensis]|uniref:uncharacterized protein n=1 Tax=Lipomyces chichibuensis TaxID=1546026 RepID=UPI003343B56A